MSEPTLAATHAALNRIKAASAAAVTTLLVIRAAILGMVTISVWSLVRPQAELEQLALGALVMLLALAQVVRRRRDPPVSLPNLALALEMQHSATTRSTLTIGGAAAPAPSEWHSLLSAETKQLRRYEFDRNIGFATSLLLPLAVSLVTLPNTAPSFKLALSEVTNAVSMLTRGATLKIVQGAATEKDADKEFKLSAATPVDLELLAQNLVEVRVSGTGNTTPTVELRKPQADGQAATVYQSFQMMPLRESRTSDSKPGEAGDAGRYSISFAVSDAVELFVPALDDKKPLAKIKVRQLPIPKVTLTATSELEDPWPDDQPLGLKIKVVAENPLQTVRLLIRSGQRVSKELVANVMAEDKLEITTDYRLVLEQYVESDLAQVEIVAEAIDRSVPAPLVGYSEPLKINTASAYGRYRATLQTLRDLKQHTDDALQKQEPQLPKEAKDLANKASDQSEKSPFFDGLDRVQIHRFEAKVDELAAANNPQTSAEQLLELSQGLNDFLFEHEVLDDRERDRDYFVAIRGLSRLVEQEPQKRPVAVKIVKDRIAKFLDDRAERWKKRVERLPKELIPQAWAEIEAKRPFNTSLDKVETLDEKAKTDVAAKNDQLKELSRSVVDYRGWIESLEAAEDKMREQEEKQRQEGLASARDTMRELQKRQGEISADLDRAGERSQADLEQKWPNARMKENTNAKETKRLESQMRSLSPNANTRIQAAQQAMESTLEYGNQGNYQLAESSSDLAGRLLRQAEKAAQQSQQKRRNRGRRRRVTGDNYYGQSVVGGDIEIKREYQVDRRYREDILDEVQSANLDEENQQLLENYLRQVIR